MPIYINDEGQLALSFSLGILMSPYTYRILWLIVFLIVYEIGYFLVYKKWFLKLRLGLIAAYLLGLIIGVYALDRYIDFI